MYFKAFFSESGDTETVYITNGDGFQTYSEVCGNVPLTIDFEGKTIIVHEN